MKILYFHQYFTFPGKPGGTRSFETAKRLANNYGHEIHIITTRMDSGSESGWKQTVIDGFTVHSINVAYSNKMSFWRRIRSFLQYAILAGIYTKGMAADLIFASSTPLTISIPAFVSSKLNKNAKIIIEVRDLWPEVPIALGYLDNPILRILAITLEKFTYSIASGIVALSTDMAESVVAKTKKLRPLIVVPNAADIENFTVDANQVAKWRKENNFLLTDELIVHCGAIGYVNGTEFLVEVAYQTAKSAPHIKYVLIGDGPAQEKVNLLASKLGVLNKNFFILPPVSKSTIPLVFGASSLSIVMVAQVKGLEKNSANKFFDTLAAGKPVVINYGGWQKEVIEKYKCGLVLDPKDPQAAGERIQELINDEVTLSSMSDNSRFVAEKIFNRDILVSELNEFFLDVTRTSRLVNK